MKAPQLFAAHAALLLFVLIFSAVRRAHPTAGRTVASRRP